MTKRISIDAMAVLSECVQEGQVVKITSGQLERKLYEEVNAVLSAIGGKWNRFKKVHVFEEPENEVSDMLEACLATGLVVPLRPAGYFPTPFALAERMCDLADICFDMKVLEPSAGKGDLASVIAKRKPLTLTLVENDPNLARELDKRFDRSQRSDHPPYITIFPVDFFSMDEKYDAVVMNPPFIRLSEIDHIMHAWDCLTCFGKVVSVASASVTFHRAKKAVDFREFVKDHGRIEACPPGSFKESGTMVQCVLVILDKKTR